MAIFVNIGGGYFAAGVSELAASERERCSGPATAKETTTPERCR